MLFSKHFFNVLNKHIAEDLKKTPKTIKTHTQNPNHQATNQRGKTAVNLLQIKKKKKNLPLWHFLMAESKRATGQARPYGG